MKIPLEAVVQLLHENNQAALATLSRSSPGYPFASVLPFAPDPDQCPVFLMSRLAEHTRNLLADPHASLVIQAPGRDAPEASPRLTLQGEIRPIEATPALVARYLRYLPGAERYLELGDFGFYRMTPQRLRLVAGFGQVGWIERAQWQALATLPPEEESRLMALIDEPAVIGVDCYGIDRFEQGARRRIGYPRAVAPQDVPAMLETLGILR